MTPGAPPYPASPPRGAVRFLRVVGLVLGGLFVIRFGVALRQSWNVPPPMDDAYMFYRYAVRLLAGDGFAWNPAGPQTFGCTSILYVFWIAGLRFATSLSFERVLALGSWIPALLTAGVLAAACARGARGVELRRWTVAMGFVALCVGVQRSYFFHAHSGMDTTLAMLTNAVLVWAVVGPKFAAKAGHTAGAAVLGYLAFLARPDNLLYAFFFPAVVLAATCEPSTRRRRMGQYLGTLVALLAIDTLVKTALFGNPLPLPFYAKTGHFYDGYIGAAQWNPVGYVQTFTINNAIPLLVLIAAGTRSALPFISAALIPTLLTFAYYATVTQIMGYQARFYYPALPFLVASAYVALDRRLARRETTPRLARPLPAGRLGALAAAAVMVFPISDRAAKWYADHHAAQAGAVAAIPYSPRQTAPEVGPGRAMLAVARLVQQGPPDAVWAMSEHGYVSAAAPNVTIVDLVGLHDPHTLMGGSVVAQLFADPPDAIWLPHHDYTAMVAGILAHPTFVREYDFWPGAFDYGLALHRTSPWRHAIRREMAQVWREMYGAECPPPSQRRR